MHYIANPIQEYGLFNLLVLYGSQQHYAAQIVSEQDRGCRECDQHGTETVEFYPSIWHPHHSAPEPIHAVIRYIKYKPE